MDQTGMWELFFATGRPEVYLAVRAQREAKRAPGDSLAERHACGAGAGSLSAGQWA